MLRIRLRVFWFVCTMTCVGCIKPLYEQYPPTIIYNGDVRLTDKNTLSLIVEKRNDIFLNIDSAKLLPPDSIKRYSTSFSPNSSFRFTVPKDNDTIYFALRSDTSKPIQLFSSRLQKGFYYLIFGPNSLKIGVYFLQQTIGDSTVETRFLWMR